MDNKELIERLHGRHECAMNAHGSDLRLHYEAAEALAKADELIQQQATALAEKDEAFMLLGAGHRFNVAQLKPCEVHAITFEAIAIQPCPEVLRKVKADAVAAYVNALKSGNALAAIRIERGEVE